jgi:hypothetical protein
MPHAAARAHRGSYGELGGGFFMVKIDLPQTAAGEVSESSRALGRMRWGECALATSCSDSVRGHLSGLVSIQIGIVEVWHAALE